MMGGLGYFGSSSSSSLSPLAPPFTVGRSKPPLVLSNDPSSYAAAAAATLPFSSSSSSSWPYSSTAAASSSSSPDTPPPHMTTCSSSNNIDDYIIPNPNYTTTHNWSAVNPNAALDHHNITPPPIAQPHWRSALNPNHPKRNDFTEPKPFYPIAASSVIKNHHDHDDFPLVNFSEADLLATSGGLVHRHHHHDETSSHAIDYTRSLSGLEYSPHRSQEGVWTSTSTSTSSRLPSTDDGKPLKIGDSFFSEDPNIAAAAASLAYTNYFNQGSSFDMATLNKGKDDTHLYYADIKRRPNSIGPIVNGKSNGTSFFASSPNELSKGDSNFTEFAMFSEAHPLTKSPEGYPWNSQKSSPYEKRYHITKSAPLVIKPPAAVSAQPKGSSSSSLEIGNLNISDVVAAGSHSKSLKEKELHQGLEPSGSFLLAPNQLSFQMGRTDEQHILVPCPSSTKEDDMHLNFDFKARPSFQVPDINIPNAETLNSASDHHNPAEDSPCWKGASSPHFEAQSPPTKKLQTAGNTQASTQIDYCSQNHHLSDEKTSGPPPPTTTTTFFPFEKEHTGEVVNAGFTSIKASSGGDQSIHDDTIKPNKGHEYTSTSSNANSQAPKLLDLPNPQDDAIITSPDARKVNTASTLVKALYDLSDLLLRDFTLNDQFALNGHHHKTLDHVIHNLGTCMSRQGQAKLMSQQKSSDGSQQVAYPGKSQVINETSGILHDGQAHKKPKSGAFDNKVDKLLQHASVRDTPPKDDNNLVQAIKKLLDENLECEVELPSESLLYKNLWLEAEAELCSLSYRTRFERLKRETQKHKSTATDASAAAAIKEILSCNGSPDVKANSSKASNAHHVDDVEAPIMARYNILKRRGEQSPITNIEEGVARVKVKGSEVNMRHQLCKDDDVVVGSGKDDVDPWVMARLNILKSRKESDAAIEIEEDKQVRDYGKEREATFQGEAEEDEDEDAAAAAVGSGSDWEHIIKDDFNFSWRLS